MNKQVTYCGHIRFECLEPRLMLSAAVGSDLYEENDTIAVVDSRLAGGVNSPNFGKITQQVNVSGLTMDDAADWYRFETLSSGVSGSLARIDFSHASGDLDMAVYSANGTRIGLSQSVGNFEQISLANQPAGVYYVYVYGYKGIHHPSYSMKIVPPATAGIAPDAYEDNDSAAIVNARPVGGANSPNLGVLSEAKSVTGLTMEDAADWYRFETAATGGSSSNVSINFQHANGDLDLSVYRSNGTTLVSTSQGVGNSEQVSLANQPAGVYYVRVYGYLGVSNPSYSLSIQPPAAVGGITPDAYEDNDTVAIVNARPVGGASSPNLGVLSQSRSITGLTMEDAADWYRFETTATSGSGSNVSMSFQHASGDLDLSVYRSNGTTLVSTSQGVGNSEQVSLANQPAGVYYAKVYGYLGASNPSYSLNINLSTASQTGINVWYGSQQYFGQNGNPQRWINVLGNASDPAGIRSLSYRLNGGPSSALSIGPDSKRLAAAGDFNVEIDRADLVRGANSIAITATNNNNSSTTQTVNVQYDPTGTASMPYYARWGQVSSPTQVAQVVDGQWGIQNGMLRTLAPGYDRVVALGDVSWQDYEITVPITMHEQGGGRGIGIVSRWIGHHAWNNAQPTWGWTPSGATAWYYWPSGNGALKITGNTNDLVQRSRSLSLGVSYTWKFRAETQSDGRTLYNLKVWQTNQSEPSAWDMSAYGDSQNLPRGSLLLVAHLIDASFGDVTIRAI